MVSKKRIGLLAVLLLVIVSIAIFFASNSFLAFNPVNPIDVDGDGLLNGNNEALPKDSSKAKEYINAGIMHRVNDDESLTFFGEKTLGSDPHIPSPDAVDQAYFLRDVSQAEYNKIEADGNLSNFNIDNDEQEWSNRFEQLTGSPYDVKNDIYYLLMTLAGRDYKPVDEMHKIIKDVLKVPDENVYSLNLNDNNVENFTAAVNDIAKRADGNDIVLVNINGDGGVGMFYFYDEMYMNYESMDQLLDKIDSKLMFINVEACHSGSAINYLEGGNRIILTNSSDKERSAFGTGHQFLKAFSNHLADTDGNDYVSIGEAAEYAKNMETYPNRTPQISDPNNIGPTSYLVELDLKE